MPEDSFQRLPGVLETVVGYCGGQQADPTYTSIGDHTEAIRVTFDPRMLPLDEVYRIFWREHTPSPKAFGLQYRSAVFFHSPTQLQVASAVREQLKGDSPFSSELDQTDLEVAGRFYRAEEYHQRFLEKQRRGSLWTPSI
jgi:peptide-methionine (S)-S-oxide reductase